MALASTAMADGGPSRRSVKDAPVAAAILNVTPNAGLAGAAA